jgi:hypothetical protein
MNRSLLTLALLSTLAGVAGCGGAQTLASAGDASPRSSDARAVFAVPKAPASSAPLAMYLSGQYPEYSGSAGVLDAIAIPSLEVTRIDQSFSGPFTFGPLAVGPRTLYSVGSGVGAIYEFSLGDPNVAFTLSNGGAIGLAADRKDNVYVLNPGSEPNVTVYPSMSASPLRTITQGITTPEIIAIGPNGDLYVGNSDSISQYAPNGATPIRTITAGVASPNGFAWDRRGRLLVANSNAVTIYQPKGTNPIVTITQGIMDATCVAVGPTGTVYVGDSTTEQITEYDNERPRLSRTITEKRSAQGHRAALMYVDAADTVYVLNRGPRPRLQYFLSKEIKPAGGTGFLETAFAYGGSALGPAW